MKALYSAVLIANLVIEAVGAGALFFAPEILVDVGNASARLWSWNYGFVALAIASAVFTTKPETMGVVGTGRSPFRSYGASRARHGQPAAIVPRSMTQRIRTTAPFPSSCPGSTTVSPQKPVASSV